MALLKCLSQFCHNTSLKGIPRAAKAETTYFKYIWITAVLGFSLACALQLALLLVDFFSYPTNTNVSSKNMDTFHSNVLQAHTLCFLRPTFLAITDTTRFMEIVSKKIQCVNCSETTINQRQRLKQHLLSPQGYYQYVGKEGVSDSRFEIEEILLSCHIRILTAGSSRNTPCGRRVNITKVVHPSFYNCFRLQLPRPEYPHFLPLGITLDLFINNLGEAPYKVFSPPEEYTQSAGVVFSIEELDAMPFASLAKTIAAPGMHTDIQYRVQEYKTLPAPYGNCVIDEDIDMSQFPDFSWQSKIKYSQGACLILCNTYGIRGKCGCTSVDSSHGMVEATEEYPYCANASLSLEDLVRFEGCLFDRSVDIMAHCRQDCQTACHWRDFDQQVSSANWPLKAFHDAFYDRYVTNGTLKSRFVKSEESLSKNNTGCNSQCDMDDKIRKANLIQSNFLKLSTHIHNFRVGRMEDTPKYNIASLMSQLGGLLNLWSGITVYLFVELLELGIRLAIAWFGRGTRKVKVQEQNKSCDDAVKNLDSNGKY